MDRDDDCLVSNRSWCSQTERLHSLDVRQWGRESHLIWISPVLHSPLERGPRTWDLSAGAPCGLVSSANDDGTGAKREASADFRSSSFAADDVVVPASVPVISVTRGPRWGHLISEYIINNLHVISFVWIIFVWQNVSPHGTHWGYLPHLEAEGITSPALCAAMHCVIN